MQCRTTPWLGFFILLIQPFDFIVNYYITHGAGAIRFRDAVLPISCTLMGINAKKAFNLSSAGTTIGNNAATILLSSLDGCFD